MSAGLDVAARGLRSGDGTTARSRLTSGLLTARFWVIAVVLLAIGVGALVYASLGRLETGPLNPRSSEPEGGRAYIEVLRERGYPVRTTESYADARGAAADGATVMLYDDESNLTAAGAAGLSDSAAEAGADIVLLSPSLATLTAMDLPVSPAGDTAAESPLDDPTFFAGIEASTPGCPDPVANRAGSLSGGGTHYRLVPGTPGSVCFPSPERPLADSGTVVRIPATEGAPSATVIGNWAIASNALLDEHGNASLLINAGTTGEELVVYQPERDDQVGQPVAGEQESLPQLMPPGAIAAALWLFPVLIAFVLWKARRLGPLVVEPRPVLVRAVELQEGRAALYRSQEARERALHHVRRRTRRALMRRLRVAEPYLEATVAQSSGRSLDEVHALLTTAQPQTDAELADLARRLLTLESEVLPQ